MNRMSRHRVFVRGMESETYDLDEERKRRLALPRVVRLAEV